MASKKKTADPFDAAYLEGMPDSLEETARRRAPKTLPHEAIALGGQVATPSLRSARASPATPSRSRPTA